MADERVGPKKVEGEVKPIAPSRREQKVIKMAARLSNLERGLDSAMAEFEPAFLLYVALYRIRHGCDPDTGDCPFDYLSPEPPEEEE